MIQIKTLAKKHSSFLVIVIGAFAIFAANVLLKKVLSPEAYGEYSILITFFQVISSFGLLGFEQVFLRISEVKKHGIIQTDNQLSVLLLLVWVVFGGVSSYLFHTYFSNIGISYFYYFAITLIITLSMFLFNMFRLNSDFTVSQLILNSWKFFVLALCLFFLWQHIDNIRLFVKMLSYCLFGVFIVQVVYGYKNIVFDFLNKYSLKELSLYALHFFISLLTLTFVGYSDRFIVKSEFGSEILGEYFFLATIFFFPYALIQGYVGFKELVAFKKEGSLKGLGKKLLRINILGVFLGIAIVLASVVINNIELLPYIDIENNVLLIAIFIATGIVKLNYSLLSALLGAKGEVKTIKNANLQSLLLILVIGAVFYSFFNSIEMVALAFLLFWISRTVIWGHNLNRQFK